MASRIGSLWIDTTLQVCRMTWISIKLAKKPVRRPPLRRSTLPYDVSLCWPQVRAMNPL